MITFCVTFETAQPVIALIIYQHTGKAGLWKLKKDLKTNLSY